MTKTEATYHGSDFRTYPTELVVGPGGVLIGMQLCEELDLESGRWEPFYSVDWISR